MKRFFLSFGQYEAVILFTGLALFLLWLFVFLSGYLRVVVSAEALYDFGYPALFPFPESVTEFFKDRVQARFMHGVLVTILYKSLRFNPPGFYLTVAAMMIASAAAITLLLKEYVKPSWRAGLLVVLLSVLPTLLPILISLKRLHHALAWACFWWACLSLRNWLIRKHAWWLLSSAVFFVIAWLSYESIAFLLPVAVFMSAPKVKSLKQLLRGFGLAVAITLLAYGVYQLVAFLLGVVYERIVQTEFLGILFSPFRALVIVMSDLIAGDLGGNFAFSDVALLFAKLVFLSLLVFGFMRVAFDFISNRVRLLESETFWLSISGLWLTFFTYIPFYLVRHAPDEDSLMGSGYGFVFLLVAFLLTLEKLQKPRLAATLLVLISLGMISSASVSYYSQIAQVQQSDQHFVNFVRSLREQVPGVRENSTFVLVNTNWGRTGCIGYMNMLYARKNLHCIHLLEGDTQETYERMPDGWLIENTGRIFEPDFIVVRARPDGYAEVLDFISPVEYPLLPLQWNFSEPLYTNYERILPQTSGRSEFYEYLLTLP